MGEQHTKEGEALMASSRQTVERHNEEKVAKRLVERGLRREGGHAHEHACELTHAQPASCLARTLLH